MGPPLAAALADPAQRGPALGARAWLVDWEVAGVAPPYYDLATPALFLRLEDERAFELAAAHDGAEVAEGLAAMGLALLGEAAGVTRPEAARSSGSARR